MRITGLWKVTADDPRFFGLSALAVLLDGRLQAMSDSGVLVTMPRPGQQRSAVLRDLPDGPGFPTFKRFRDSEAMIVDADDAGRFVAFENQHGLWRFEWNGAASRLGVPLPSASWKANKGVEAMVEDTSDGALLLIPESDRRVLRIADSMTPDQVPLAGATGGIADAAQLPDGRMVVAVREVGLTGLSNRLAWLEHDRSGYRLRNFARLPLGPLDNVEGLAAEQGPGGRTILWAITDNDGWRRTLLLRLELDAVAPTKIGISGK